MTSARPESNQRVARLGLTAHLLACTWMSIGCDLLYTENVGWIRKSIDEKKLIDDEYWSLYICSIYFIMTSFSSVGYGDITGQVSVEYLYQCLVEMLGLGIFGYMTGIIQGVMMKITEADQSSQF